MILCECFHRSKLREYRVHCVSDPLRRDWFASTEPQERRKWTFESITKINLIVHINGQIEKNLTKHFQSEQNGDEMIAASSEIAELKLMDIFGGGAQLSHVVRDGDTSK